jgi:hypothetical protein
MTAANIQINESSIYSPKRYTPINTDRSFNNNNSNFNTGFDNN